MAPAPFRSVACFAFAAACGTLAGMLPAQDAPAADAKADAWRPVAEALGVPGKLTPDGAFRVEVPRREPPLTNEYGFPVPASMVLTYAAFAGSPADATVFGDTCVLGPEVNPVIDALRAGGIEIVAVHNHMLGGSPNFIFVHFQGRGAAVALAKTIRAAWDEMAKGHTVEPRPAAEAPRPDWQAVAAAVGRQGVLTGDGMFKVTLPRPHLGAKLDGRAVPAGTGLACWVGFAPCACGETMIMGDTCLLRSELQAAIDGYRRHGLRILAIHNHVLGTDPELIFCHFGGEGDAVELARAVCDVWAGLDDPKRPASPGR